MNSLSWSDIKKKMDVKEDCDDRLAFSLILYGIYKFVCVLCVLAADWMKGCDGE